MMNLECCSCGSSLVVASFSQILKTYKNNSAQRRCLIGGWVASWSHWSGVRRLAPCFYQALCTSAVVASLVIKFQVRSEFQVQLICSFRAA